MTKLLVIDTETGGIDPDRHSLLSIAAVVWADGRIESEIQILVGEADVTVTARALEINRIDLVEHARGAVPPAEALSRLLEFVAEHFRLELESGEQVVLVGHNVAFDVGFLKRLCRLAGSDFPAQFSHRMLDTAACFAFPIHDRACPYLGGSLYRGLCALRRAFPQNCGIRRWATCDGGFAESS